VLEFEALAAELDVLELETPLIPVLAPAPAEEAVLVDESFDANWPMLEYWA
jgi:hypothetical protein